MATYRSTTRTDSNGLAVAGLVCGIIGVFLFNIVLGPLAIIFGGVGLSRAKRGAPHRAMSIWAIVLGSVALVLFAVLIAVSAGHHFSYHVG
jgi:hypothetical protein